MFSKAKQNKLKGHWEFRAGLTSRIRCLHIYVFRTTTSISIPELNILALYINMQILYYHH